MISVITWLWGKERFKAEHVQRLKKAVHNHLTLPHEFVCITEADIPGVKTIRPIKDPAESKGCLGRLDMLCSNNNITNQLRPWIWNMDLDTVILGDIDHMFSLVIGSDKQGGIYVAPSVGKKGIAYNPGFFLFYKGAFNDIYLKYQVEGLGLHKKAQKEGWIGTDQAIIGYLASRDLVAWGVEQGIYSFRDNVEPRVDKTDERLKVVQFYDRWPELQGAMCPGWLTEAWLGKEGASAGLKQASFYNEKIDYAVYDGPLNYGRKFFRLLPDSSKPKTVLFLYSYQVPRGAVAWLPYVNEPGWKREIENIQANLNSRGIKTITCSMPCLVDETYLKALVKEFVEANDNLKKGRT